MKTKFLLVFIFFVSIFRLTAQTVVDIIVNSPNHNTLEAAVTAAGLVPTLQGSGPFTIFAPTDEAFAALPAGTVEALLLDPQGELTRILTYHAVSGKVLSTDLVNGQFAKTINGKSISVKFDNGKAFVNNAEVTTADLNATNGVVHVINKVLLPPKTIVDVVINSPIHTTLVAAVSAAGLVPTLQGNGPFTVFAPTDEAFAALPAGTVESLLADPNGLLTQILLYHTLSSELGAAAVIGQKRITTINGRDVIVTTDIDGVYINDAKVTVTDVEADNGVVHVIDAVLIPSNTLFDVIATSPNHNTLEAAIRAADLADILSGEDDFSVFAPTDAAFAALPAGTVEALLNDIPTLTDILLRHVVYDDIDTDDFKNDGPLFLNTLGGANTVVENNNGSFFVDGIKIDNADIEADNGFIHSIGQVILPIDSTIQDVVENSPVHNTLELLINSANVDEISLKRFLESYGPFTLFAPVDDAFKVLTPDEVQFLLDNPESLINVLGNHLVLGRIKASDLYDGQILETGSGGGLRVRISNGKVTISDSEVILADINTDNGIVHVTKDIVVASTITVMDIVRNSLQHKTLRAAIEAAKLDGALSDKDAKLTLFAPTDAAFAALPAGTVESLLADPQGALTQILTYHVLGSIVTSGNLSDGLVVPTLNGKSVTVKFQGDKIFINNAQVTVADILTENGVVHVIDAVLLPPRTTVVDVIVNSPDHNTLEAAVKAAGLVTTLQGDGPFTIFAPTDGAFAALPAGTVEALLADPQGALTQVLTYHAVTGKALSTDLSNGQVIKTVNGKSVIVTISNGSVFINNAKVTVADIVADNGVVHVIDAVLLPPRTVADIILNSPFHNTLEVAVKAAGLVPTLSGNGPFTIFAPTDAAFALLPAGTVEALLADPQGALTRVLTYHAVAGKSLSTDLSNGQEITTINGQKVKVSITNGNVFINNAKVIVADLLADNGVVHVIDAVLLPSTSTNEIDANSSDITVSPNPFNNEFNINYSNVSTNPVNVVIKDATGKVIQRVDNVTSSVQTQIPNGVYYIKIANEDFITTKKVIKVN